MIMDRGQCTQTAAADAQSISHYFPCSKTHRSYSYSPALCAKLEWWEGCAVCCPSTGTETAVRRLTTDD